MKELSFETIDRIARNSETAVDYLINLYKEVLPDFENCARVDGWPRVSIDTVSYIFAACPINGKDGFATMWMNKGFGGDPDMDDFVVDLENCKLEYA